MNIFNARCCLLTLFFFLFEKKFCKKGAVGASALSNEPIYYAPSGGLPPCVIISRQLSGDEEDGSEDNADDGGLSGEGLPYEEGKKSDLVNDTPSQNLDGDEDEDTAKDGTAKRKMSKKEEEEEDKKIDKLVNAEMKKQEAENDPDEEFDAEPDNNQRSGQGRRSKLRCSNKLNYIQVTANDQGEDDLFSENDEESSPKFVELPHKIKEDTNGMPTKQNEREEAYNRIDHIDRMDRAEKESNANDLKFVEGNTFMQEGEQHNENSTDPIGERERKRSSSSSPNRHTRNSFMDLKIVPDKLPLNFTNSSGSPLFHKNLQKTVHKHSPWPILASDSGSTRASWADVNSSTYNVSPFSFISVHTHNALHLMPMNFQVQNSVMKISDEAFDKLKLQNSVNVYDKDELVDYKYENFEVKEGEEYNDGNDINDMNDVNGANEEKGGEEEGSNGEGADSNSDQNNSSDGRGFFDGSLVTYTIVILIGVIILLLSFVIYYYDLINKVKRRMSAKRKNNQSMTIANDTSAGLYMDDTYKESPHV
ncbi:Uncharacterized protein PCOAH_00030630 [Plasmodium coatneyi]|uniref:Uncharacterized protein n=1 Tax=Plasmodium coatneyi TaxID=208452 RepID=A0A1B1E0Z5_9APIC|nr:Uncharacterized protein PCOAH_00030630 [Plasmodium coatneyi]ANQ08716.1 Uncharacterized protein PCOAH_00030630 [Plasmodium coatneyi]